jgi:signal transduction histidine kinase
MQAQVEALEDGVFEITPDTLGPIRDQTLLLKRLVDDLRDLNLAEAGRLPLHVGAVNLTALLSRVVDAFQTAARAKGVALEAAAGSAAAVVSGDAQRLEQVLGNLVSNAIRHTPQGGSVAVRLLAGDEAPGFVVEDTGSGIPPDDLDRVFDRFYRADGARPRAEGSTGLGLSIAREIVEAHGGRITVESEVGRGTAFTVTLPRE